MGVAITAAQAAAAVAYGSSVRPVLFLDNRSEEEITGSCVLMRIGDRHFALTAAHVMDRLVARGHIMIGGIRDIVYVALRAYGTEIPNGGTRDDDLVDLAFLELSDAQAADLGECVWLTPEDVDWRPVPTGTDAAYLALGYPWRNSRLNRSAGRLDATPVAYGGTLAAPGLYAGTDYDPDTHIVINFNRKRIVSKAGWGVPMVKPQGMSGGGLWRFSSLLAGEPADRDRLAGILIAWHWDEQKVMVATRACIAMTMVCKIHPELKPLLIAE